MIDSTKIQEWMGERRKSIGLSRLSFASDEKLGDHWYAEIEGEHIGPAVSYSKLLDKISEYDPNAARDRKIEELREELERLEQEKSDEQEKRAETSIS